MSSLRNKVINSIGWTARNQFFTQITHFITGLILARLLAPSDFGLIAMVLSISNFFKIFVELGLSSAIIHRQENNPGELSTIFWIQVFMGALLGGLLLVGAPLIAVFFKEPVLKTLTWFVALEFFAVSFSFVPAALLRKYLDFKSLFYINFPGAIISGILAIAMAVAGFGIWSLVGRLIISSLWNTVMSWVYCGWKPGFRFSRLSVTQSVHYSLPLLGTQIINYWVRNIDDLLIGKTLGNISLGFYNRGYALMLLPINNIASTVALVLFPTLSTIREDRAQVRSIYLKTIRMVALVSFPLMAGLFVLAEPFVLVLLGTQWAGTIPVLKVLTVLGLFQTVGVLNGSVFLSQGATALQLRISLLEKIFMIAMIVFGVFYTRNIVGIALFYALASILALFPVWHFMGKLIDLKLSEMLKNLMGVLGSAVLMGLAVYGLQSLLFQHAAHLLLLLILIPSGVIIYWAIIALCKIEAYQDVKRLWLEKRT